MAELEAAPAPAQPAAPAAAPSAAPEAPADGGQAPAQTSATKAPATPAGDQSAKTDDQPEKQGQSRFQRRIDRAYRKAAEATARADFYAKQLESQQPRAQSADPTEPRLEQFDSVEKYTEAVRKHASQTAQRQYQAQQLSQTQRQAQENLTGKWESQMSRAEEKYDDFDVVVGELKPTTPWAAALMDAENGGDIAYYLGKNMKEAERIAALPPLTQIREIGKLEAKLAAQASAPKQPSKAPAPISPLSGAATADPGAPSDNDDVGTWIKKRNRQVHGNRAGR